MVASPAGGAQGYDRGVRGARHRAVVAIVVVCLTGPAVRARAVEPPAAMARGACSEASRWRLGVIRVDRGFRVGVILRTPRAGQRWNIFLEHDRVGIFAGARRTDLDGRVVVRRIVTDHPGTDRFRVGAHNTATGETCRGRVRI